MKHPGSVVTRAAKNLDAQMSRSLADPLATCGPDPIVALGAPRIRPRVVRVFGLTKKSRHVASLEALGQCADTRTFLVAGHASRIR